MPESMRMQSMMRPTPRQKSPRSFTLKYGAGSPRSSRGRGIDTSLVPVFLDQVVFHSNDVEVVPLVFAVGIVGILGGTVPHHERIRAVDQRQRRWIYPFWLDFARSTSGNLAHELFEAIAALGNVGIVLDVARVHGFVRQFQMTILKHVLQLLRGHRQSFLFLRGELACIPLHWRFGRYSCSYRSGSRHLLGAVP